MESTSLFLIYNLGNTFGLHVGNRTRIFKLNLCLFRACSQSIATWPLPGRLKFPFLLAYFTHDSGTGSCTTLFPLQWEQSGRRRGRVPAQPPGLVRHGALRSHCSPIGLSQRLASASRGRLIVMVSCTSPFRLVRRCCSSCKKMKSFYFAFFFFFKDRQLSKESKRTESKAG